MKIEVDLSDLRGAVTAAVPHMAKANTFAAEQGLGVVRLQLTGQGLQVSATDQMSLASTLIEAEVNSDEADPVDLTPTSIKGLLSVFPAPGKDSLGERIRIESRTEPGSSDQPSEHPPSSVTFTDVSGLFEGASLTVTEYPAEKFPDVPLALRGLLARQGQPAPAGLVVNPELLHRFEAASKAFGEPLEVRSIPQAPGADRGVLLVGVGSRFIGAARAEFSDEPELPLTSTWLDRLPGHAPSDPFAESLVWTTSTTDDGTARSGHEVE